MLYKPLLGKFKDNYLIHYDGRFYMFSMYMKDGGEYRNVWLAESNDGVHWDDVGLVIEDAKFLVWAMGIHQVDDRFIMNHGSFDSNGAQGVLKFWQSYNLRDWEYMGEDFDVSTTGLGLPAEARLDAMNVVRTENGYYGYATGPAGFLYSSDGIRWEFCDTKIDFREIPPPPTPFNEGIFEVGGCSELNGNFYYLGGWFNYMGRTGYGVYTLKSDNPCGPFVPDAQAYRLCGNSSRWVSLWARFCTMENEQLVTSYMQQGYSYENGDTWMPPLKKAVVDKDGHLRLVYWPGNDLLMGQVVDLSANTWHVLLATQTETRVNSDVASIQDNWNIDLQAREYPVFAYCPEEVSIALLSGILDADTGFIVSGTIEVHSRDTRLVSPSAGIVMEEGDGFGTAIWMHGCGITRIGRISWHNGYIFDCEDTISTGCAAPAGISVNVLHHFRLLIRKCMFEFYLDDMLVQTLNTTHFPDKDGLAPRSIGFTVMNGICFIREMQINSMNL